MYTICYETKLYQRAKAIRLGQKQPSPENVAVLNRIKEKYGVHAFHLEFSKDKQEVKAEIMVDRYGDGQTIGYSNTEVKNELFKLAKQDPEFANATDLQVHYESFQRVATEECYDQMKEEELPVIRQEFKQIKDVHPAARSFSVFFQTDAELGDESLKNSIRQVIQQALKKHDPFHYIEPDTFTVHFDSLENLNQNYKGDWSTYYR